MTAAAFAAVKIVRACSTTIQTCCSDPKIPIVRETGFDEVPIVCGATATSVDDSLALDTNRTWPRRPVSALKPFPNGEESSRPDTNTTNHDCTSQTAEEARLLLQLILVCMLSKAEAVDLHCQARPRPTSIVREFSSSRRIWEYLPQRESYNFSVALSRAGYCITLTSFEHIIS